MLVIGLSAAAGRMALVSGERSRLKRPRLVDVARLAGVTPAVVSTVLHNKTDSSVRVSAATAERVREAVKQLGYTPNRLARSLVVGRKHVLGVFSFEPLFAPDTIDHYSPFLRGIEEECEKRGQDVLLVTHTSRKPEKRSIFVDGVNRMDFADGAILFGMEADKREIIKLVGEGYPFVFIGRREIDGKPMPAVVTGYVDATRRITKRMLRAGHTRIAYLGLPLTREYVADREAGYRSALAAEGLGDHARVWRGPPDDVDAGLVGSLFEAGTTAFVAETPAYVERLIAESAKLGREPRRDFSFAVLSDVYYREKADPTWTTLFLPRVTLGRMAVRALLERLDDPDSALSAEQVTVPCEVRFTDSISPAPPARAVAGPSHAR